MARQTLMWTTLPNGITPDGRSLRVSVMVSPRLDPETRPAVLASFFPDWEDWPRTLSQATFHVSCGGATVKVRATQATGLNRVDDRVGVADSHVWRALFGDTLPVRGFAFKDLSDSHVLSYDTAATEGLVRHLYGELARRADGNLPRVSDLVDDPEWKALVEAVRVIDGRLSDERTGLRDVGLQFDAFRNGGLKVGGANVDTLARLQLFHTPPLKPAPVVKQPRRDDPRIDATWMEYEHSDLPAGDDLARQIDFHQVVAAMNAYPTLLRRLGLVVDLLIDREAFTPAPDAPLRTVVDFPEDALRVRRRADIGPITHAQLAADRFQPVPSPHPPADAFRVRDGLLDLDPSRFTVLQTDVDGAGLKLMGFARTLARLSPEDQRPDPVTRFEKEAGVPSLRTPGLLLAQSGRGGMLQDRFGANKTKNDRAELIAEGLAGATALQLWAEDLVRGFRVDVWDRTTGTWHSLMRREAVYSLSDGAVTVSPNGGEEEATLRLGATTSPDPSSNADIVYLHEALVAWAGWSLAAPPPGRAIGRDDGVDKNVSQAEPELPPGIRFSSRFRAVRGSLPRLRFGREYWLRGRVVDLAGNSLDDQEEDFGPERPRDHARPYLRYEPVEPPAVALVKRAEDGITEPPAEGESMERLAIRSFNDRPADNAVPSAQVARRFAVPPQVSVRHAEHHGRLDAGGRVDAAAFTMLANQKDLDATQPGAALVEETLPLKGPLDPTPVPVVFAVYREGERLTYLPDPLAETVAVRILGHPGIPPSAITDVPLYPAGVWPEARPFTIELYEQPGDAPRYDPASHALRVPLGKADRARVRLSLRLSREALHRVMGIWRWIPEADQAALEPMALDGQHWMLTPWREIEVVHAVQRPLITPEFLTLFVTRGRNDTCAVPRFLASCSLKSTDRIDLLARWHEPQDDASAVQRSDPRAAEVEVALIDRARGDTAFATKITDPTTYATRSAGQPLGGIPEHTIEGDDTIGVAWKSRDLVLTKRHEFGDTRYRRIEYWMEATTKFREYMPPEVLLGSDGTPTDDHIKVVGPTTVSWIPSSAPPPAPAVLYVVPTFGWVRARDAAGNPSSWRRGGGLRVYLDRPWSVSGYGEMLAVVLPPASFAGDPETQPAAEPYNKYVTQWGNDPIWQSRFVSGLAPRRANFPLARTAKDPSGAWLPAGAPAQEADQPPGAFPVTGLVPPGVSSALGGSVELAPHDVHYDAERRLWYCDIEVDQGGAYWPFIRLALARYQPTSVDGAHLSEVVLADVMPLAADRWLNVKPTRNERTRRVSVFGIGYSDSSGHVEAAAAPSMSVVDRLTGTVTTLRPASVSPTSVIEVWVERLDPARGEDFGWERIPAREASPGPAGPAEADLGVSVRDEVFAFVPAHEVSRALELHHTRRFSELLADGLLGSVQSLFKLWEGEVSLPPSRPEGARFRLVVAEYEEYLVDDSRPYDKVPTRKDRRLVFVEHVELT